MPASPSVARTLATLGRTEQLPYLSFSALREYACRSKINLCITRQAHAQSWVVHGRPFELASMGSCIVANPYAGVEEWFEPGRRSSSSTQPTKRSSATRGCWTHDTERRAIGEAARRRLLGEHTFSHRARQLLDIIKAYQ